MIGMAFLKTWEQVSRLAQRQIWRRLLNLPFFSSSLFAVPCSVSSKQDSSLDAPSTYSGVESADRGKLLTPADLPPASSPPGTVATSSPAASPGSISPRWLSLDSPRSLVT